LSHTRKDYHIISWKPAFENRQFTLRTPCLQSTCRETRRQC